MSQLGVEVLLASSGYKSGLLPNILQETGPFPAIKKYLAPNVILLRWETLL